MRVGFSVAETPMKDVAGIVAGIVVFIVALVVEGSVEFGVAKLAAFWLPGQISAVVAFGFVRAMANEFAGEMAAEIQVRVRMTAATEVSVTLNPEAAPRHEVNLGLSPVDTRDRSESRVCDR
jgi:hypothetical protein